MDQSTIFILAAMAIGYAGPRLERDTDAITSQTGLGASFVGFVLLSVDAALIYQNVLY